MRINFLRLPAVIAATGVCRSNIYNGINAGTFPSPIKIGARAIGFLPEEVDAVSAARIAGWAEPQIKALVKGLHAARGAALKNAQVVA
jgi:prophage regulatory protein